MDNLRYETALYNLGFEYIAGVDEVGRGPLAGPMVIAAVILPRKILLDIITATSNNTLSTNYRIFHEINDSKKISVKKRELLNELIIEHALAYTIEVIPVDVIDSKGISKTTQMGFYNAIKKLNVPPQHILTDCFAIKAISSKIQTNIPKGDTLSISIAAASIIAKVFRDNLMMSYGHKYPEYGFEKHKGYGTKEHLENITKHGICEIHRKSFEPIRSMV